MYTESSTPGDLAPPPWSSGEEVEAAVRELAAASRKTGRAAHHRVLFAIGNHHARTYWPAALALIPRLEELLSEGGDVARAQAIRVLVDLLWSRPAPGFELIETPEGPRALEGLVRAEITRLEPAIEQIEASTASPREQRLAEELLGYLGGSAR